MKKTHHIYKKINLVRIYLLLVMFLGLGSIVSAATTLSFVGINIGSINEKFSEIIFKASGNDFIGSIFWLNTKNIETGEVITVAGGPTIKKCFKQIKGIYYNSQRGNRLWPLDQDTLNYFTGFTSNYDDLNISGGLYTSCSGDEYSIYGQITYHVNGDSYDSHIVAGVKYNRTGNTINGAFAKSLQRFDNKYPIGYIYDDRGGGIGFIGGGQGNSSWHNNLIAKLDQLSGINTLFGYDGSNNSSIKRNGISISTTAGNAINTMMNAGIQGTIGLSFSMNTVEKNTILGNFDKKTLMFNALNVNFSKLINTVRKNTENLCKGKYEDGAYIDFGNDTRKLFCIEYPVANANNFIRIDDYNRQDLKNKTIIVKNGDVRIGGSMPVDGGPVNIFIDKGNLLIANNSTSAVNFDGNGYATNNVGVSKGTYLKGNFIINGLIIGADVVANTWTKGNFENKLFLNGKFASLNTPNYPSQGRINQITTLFESNVNNNRIRLGKVFTWECNPITGIGSDGSTSCSNSLDKTASLPLIIIDGYYPSNLIQ